MFKLIFRTITTIVFLIFLTVGLALWKGGEPFRWVGDGMVNKGKDISEVGNLIDQIIKGSKEVKQSYIELKEVVDSDKK